MSSISSLLTFAIIEDFGEEELSSGDPPPSGGDCFFGEVEAEAVCFVCFFSFGELASDFDSVFTFFVNLSLREVSSGEAYIRKKKKEIQVSEEGTETRGSKVTNVSTRVRVARLFILINKSKEGNSSVELSHEDLSANS